MIHGYLAQRFKQLLDGVGDKGQIMSGIMDDDFCLPNMQFNEMSAHPMLLFDYLIIQSIPILLLIEYYFKYINLNVNLSFFFW